jgi:predicted transcriptional regulator
MKRKYKSIRNEILRSLCDRPKTINEIAKEIRANWLTVERHLEWLERYKRKVRLIYKNKRLRLYDLWKR